MLNLFSQFGWVIKTGDEQKSGSSADIYLEHEGYKCTMLIDDGNCHNELSDAVYHIYVYAVGGKIFEGRIGNANDFEVVMRVLGFDKTMIEMKNKLEKEPLEWLIQKHLENNGLPNIKHVPMPVFQTVNGAVNDFISHSMKYGSHPDGRMTLDEIKSMLVRSLIHFKYGVDVKE